MNIELDFSQMKMIELKQLMELLKAEIKNREKVDNNSDISDENLDIIINKNWSYLNKNHCYHNKYIFTQITMLNLDKIKELNRRRKTYNNWAYKVDEFLIPVYEKLLIYMAENNLTYERDQLRINSFFCRELGINNIDIINTIQVVVPHNLE